jgi:HD-GYP domain-containing protein (c-di-GMP phosphodiesterase class II)
MSEQDNHNYIRNLIGASESLQISASEDIYNERGVKLLASGAKINEAMYEKLVNNKLLKPIDDSLSIENGVTNINLIQELKQLISSDFNIGFFARTLSDPQLAVGIFRQIPINAAISNKLSVTRNQAPEKFHHSLCVSLICIFIGAEKSLPEDELIKLATAGLLHDLGHMHLDPALSNRQTRLTPELRRQIYSHPIITHLILQEYPEYNPEVSRAVLEHHERLDGSGYPRGIHELSLYGSILAVAEISVALLDKMNGNPDWNQLITSIKINRGKLDGALINIMVALFKKQQIIGSPIDALNIEQMREDWTLISNILRVFSESLSSQADQKMPSFKFAEKHINALCYQISSSGIQPDEVPALIEQLGDSRDELMEMQSMAHETLYRLREIRNEVLRRWPEHAGRIVRSTHFQVWLDTIPER